MTIPFGIGVETAAAIIVASIPKMVPDPCSDASTLPSESTPTLVVVPLNSAINSPINFQHYKNTVTFA